MRVPEKISLLKESGEKLNSNIVSIFMIPDTGKRYIITTENAVDPHGLTVLHVSEIHDHTLVKVEEDEEWSAIKTIMRAIISGNVGSYQYLATMQTAKIDNVYSRDISVSSSAAKQMTDNYNAADKIASPTEANSAPSEDAMAAITPGGANVPAASIFPNGGVKPTEENEISPGIADMAAQVNPVASPQTVQAALPEDTHLTAARPAQVVATDQVAAAVQSVPAQQYQQPQYAQPMQPAQPQYAQPMQGGVVDASQMVRQQQYGTMDPNINTQMSTMGVTAGYGTMAPMDNGVYAYNQPMQPVVNLDAIIAEAQEKFNESIRTLVYSIYEKVQNEGVTKQVVQQTVQQMQPVMQQAVQSIPTQQYQQPQYAQPMQQPQYAQPMSYTQQIPVVNAYPQGYQQPMLVSAINDNRQ